MFDWIRLVLFEVAVKLSSLSWKVNRNVVDLERLSNTTVELFTGNTSRTEETGL